METSEKRLIALKCYVLKSIKNKRAKLKSLGEGCLVTILKRLLAVLVLTGASVNAETTNYFNISIDRFLDVRQRQSSGPTIKNYSLLITLNLRDKKAVKRLELQSPKAKKYAFGNSDEFIQNDPLSCLVNSGGLVKDYLKELPAGRYKIKCLRGRLAGQVIEFFVDLNLMHPVIPYLEKKSFDLLSSGRLNVSRDNTLIFKRLMNKRPPFLQNSQDAKMNLWTVNMLRRTSKGSSLVNLRQREIIFNSSGIATFTIPRGTLAKNSTYLLDLYSSTYDWAEKQGSAITPEGTIPTSSKGSTYFLFMFTTAK